MLKALAPSLVMTITRIDRVARFRLNRFTTTKQTVDATAQSSSPIELLVETSISPGLVTIIVAGGLADVVRDLLRSRTEKGRNRTNALGQHMSHLAVFISRQLAEARQGSAEGTKVKAPAQNFNAGEAAISRLCLGTSP